MSRFSAIPGISGLSAELQRVLRPIKENLENLNKFGASSVDDDALISIGRYLGENPIGDGSGETPSYYDPSLDSTVPSAPTGLKASGAIKNIIVRWEGLFYLNHSYTEIYRATTNNRGAALLIGTSSSEVFIDDTAVQGVDYYYWVRFRTEYQATAVYSDWSNGATDGQPGKLARLDNIAEFASSIAPIEIVTTLPTTGNFDGRKVYLVNGTIGQMHVYDSGDWTQAPGVTIGDNSIEAGQINTASLTADQAFMNELKAAVIAADWFAAGTAIIGDAAIDAAMIADGVIGNLTVGEGTIGTAHFVNTLDSTGYQPGVYGWRILKSGTVEFNDAHIRGTLYGVDGTFSGTLTATAVDAVDTINLRGDSVSVQSFDKITDVIHYAPIQSYLLHTNNGVWTPVLTVSINHGVTLATRVEGVEITGRVPTMVFLPGGGTWRVVFDVEARIVGPQGVIVSSLKSYSFSTISPSTAEIQTVLDSFFFEVKDNQLLLDHHSYSLEIRFRQYEGGNNPLFGFDLLNDGFLLVSGMKR